ncbi:MAG: polysaccharide biosynthesis/export family protein [Flavitalea sp.]
MRKIDMKKSFLAILLGIVVLSSCTTSKQLAYFQDLPQEKGVSNVPTAPYTALKLEPNDEVQVTISSTSPELSQFFNLTAVTPMPSAQNGAPSTNSNAAGFINIYRVSATGNIILPVLGEVRALGLTTEQLRILIKEKLTDYLKDAIVTVTLTNFKVTVIGEVTKPIVVPVNGQTINVLEAIGASGDMTVYGIRKNVRILRKQPDGTTEIAVLDFNNSSTLTSPYFQLKQNDIVYIQPNKSKGLAGTRASIFIPVITGIISVAVIIITRI